MPGCSAPAMRVRIDAERARVAADLAHQVDAVSGRRRLRRRANRTIAAARARRSRPRRRRRNRRAACRTGTTARRPAAPHACRRDARHGRSRARGRRRARRRSRPCRSALEHVDAAARQRDRVGIVLADRRARVERDRQVARRLRACATSLSSAARPGASPSASPHSNAAPAFLVSSSARIWPSTASPSLRSARSGT